MTANNIQNNPDNNGNGQKKTEVYSFIKETRKKKPEDGKTWIKRILAVACLAIAAGLLAGLMFVLSVPVFQKLISKTVKEEEKIEMAAVAASSEEEEEEVDNTTPIVITKEEEPEDLLKTYSKTYQEIAEVAKTAQNSMVEVIGITNQLDYFNNDYENRQSVSGLLVAESQTSLYCLTENRNLKKAESIQVIFGNGSRANAEFKASDKETNLAILSINRADLEDNTWNSISIASFGNYNTLRLGSPVIAVGSIAGLGDSMEYGIITSMKNTVSFWDVNYNVLTTDMIGNSLGSGCIINLQGEVLGIISQNLSTDNQNLLTAIPVKQLNTLIETLINDKAQIRVGIKGQTVSSDISETSGIPRGVLVSAVEAESPAMYAGIKELDVITAVAGEEVENFQSYQRIVSSLSEGAEITVNAMRMGKETYEEISFQLKPETK